MPEPLLKVKNLKKYFPIRGGLFSREVARVHAVDDVTFDIMAGGDTRPGGGAAGRGRHSAWSASPGAGSPRRGGRSSGSSSPRRARSGSGGRTSRRGLDEPE